MSQKTDTSFFPSRVVISNIEQIQSRRSVLKWLLTPLFSCIALCIGTPAQTFTVVASFNGTNGAKPLAALVRGWDGNFYGPTTQGGTYSGGTVFKVTPQDTLTAIYDFCAQFNCPDGREIDSQMIEATNGNFYGTTTFGGINNNYGTVYKITPGGTLTTIYKFCSQMNCSDGSNPYGGIIQAKDGNFYGTTNAGGDDTCHAPYGCGTVYKLTPAGVLTTLYRFHSTDGQLPFSGLVQGTDGNFYGTTGYGGTYGWGTVFRITPNGHYKALYSFCAQKNCADGSLAYGVLTQASDGNFYGMTETGGTLGNYGTVFKITPNGVLTTLHMFQGGPDGGSPLGNDALVQATDGNFYGATEGTVFKMTFDGTVTPLVVFGSQNTDYGNYPSAVIQSTDGNFYGTTQTGGDYNNGMIFRVSVGLAPFVEMQPTSAKVGAKVLVLGNKLTGTTSVSFNGTQAAFFVTSDTEIRATVPSGAKTGSVTVTTPNGMLTSNKTFLVIPLITSFSPTSGPVGTQVAITGSGLLQTTKVIFGGNKSASFNVNSDSQVTAIVPVGAKTGPIAITTVGGTASKGTFTVTP